MGEDADEVFLEERAQAVTSRWQKLLNSGWLTCNSAAAVARWIADNSYVEGRYAAKDVIEALGAFGLLKVEDMANAASPVEFTNLTQDACFGVMPDTSARVCFRNVLIASTLQSALQSVFVGKNGSNLRRIQDMMTTRLGNFKCGGSVRLHVQTGAVHIRCEMVPSPFSTATLDSEQVLNSLVAEVIDILNKIYTQRLQKGYQRRAGRQQHRQKEGRQQLLKSHHLMQQLKWSSRITRALQNKRGSMRRLRRHFKELATAAGKFVPDVSLPVVDMPKQSTQLRRERKPGRGISSELAAVRDMLD